MSFERQPTFRPLPLNAFVADTNVKTQIPRDNLIQLIILRFTVKVTNPAGGTTLVEDGILNIAKLIRVVARGKDTLRSVTPRFLSFIESYELGAAPELTQPTLTVGSFTGNFTVVLDFKTDRKDNDDLSALLPALDFSSLDLFIDWGKAADISATSGFTVDAGTQVDIEIKEYDPAGIDRAQLLDIRESYDTITNDKKYDSFNGNSLPVNIVPVPSTVLAHALLGIQSGVRSNATITDILVQRAAAPKIDKIQRTYAILRQNNKTEFSQESLITGFSILDYVNALGTPLDMEEILPSGNPAKEGDYKLRFLTATPAGTSQIQLFTRYVV